MLYIMCQVPVGLCTVAYLILIAQQSYITCYTCCRHREQLPLEHTLISVAIFSVFIQSFFCLSSQLLLSFCFSVFLKACISLLTTVSKCNYQTIKLSLCNIPEAIKACRDSRMERKPGTENGKTAGISVMF